MARLLLTSDPSRSDGCICITPKLVEEGKVTPFLVRQARPGALVRLGGVEGGFVLPDPLPDKLLFISAGSGVTPIMSMLRISITATSSATVHIHSARTQDDVIFGERLKHLASTSDGYVLKLRLTGEEDGSGRPTSTTCARTGVSARPSSRAPRT